MRYYGEVASIQRVRRKELFPNEMLSARSDQEYYRITLKSLEEHAEPIPSQRPRRSVFIPTTMEKFSLAEELNDLFDDSPLEDKLWRALIRPRIKAERQWGLQVHERYYVLDFALFCNKGNVDVETDGDTWHANKERSPLDNQRNNDLEVVNWSVLRFNTLQINEQLEDYCLPTIQDKINHAGGLSDQGLVPRKFFTHQGKSSSN